MGTNDDTKNNRDEMGRFIKGHHYSTATEFPKGIVPPTCWKKGMTPWNKGKKDIYSAETRKKMGAQNIGRKHTEEFKKARQQRWLGHNNPLWRGGITPEDMKRTTVLQWKKIAQRIRKRDNFICQQCGKKRSTIVHHIISWHLTHDDSDDNLITLCRGCHAKVHRVKEYIGIAQ